MTDLDLHFREQVEGFSKGDGAGSPGTDDPVPDDALLALLSAQLQARHVDLLARELQARQEGYYTIGSMGHESNAAVAMSLRVTDPALLHYRSAGFYCARAAQRADHDPVHDILVSLMASSVDPISGGRHKVFGHKALSIIPQTSTIASHLPRAVGLAFAHERGHRLGTPDEWPRDAVVVASVGDASLNHSTAAGALNAAMHAVHQGVPLPLLLVIEDNGIGISVKSPRGWVESAVARLDQLGQYAVDGSDPVLTLAVAGQAVEQVRTERRPAVLHLRTVRLGGHAGSDTEIAYRSSRDIAADHQRDPLLGTARAVVERGLLTPADILRRNELTRRRVADTAEALLPPPRLTSAAAVSAPTHLRSDLSEALTRTGPDRRTAFRGRLPEAAGPLTLAQAINATLTDLMHAHPRAVVFGQDVGVKGGVYGVTRGLRRAFGAARVFDTLLDEQTILGTALGSALAGLLPIPEIQYLAYVHNAIDQLRGEAATLAFFSNGQYRNGMVVRIPGLAYQRGFGGHFHNDNSVASLLDIPGLVVAVPSSAAEAPGLLRSQAAMAVAEGRVCVFLEPIALYHSRDLLEPGDFLALAPYLPPERWVDASPDRDTGRLQVLGTTRADVLVVTFGNGVGMARRAIAAAEVRADVYDLRWLAPIPAVQLNEVARAYSSVLVVDETRRSGGVSERVVTALVDSGYPGTVRRVTSQDSVIPLGPASATVLLDEASIAGSLIDLTPPPGGRNP